MVHTAAIRNAIIFRMFNSLEKKFRMYYVEKRHFVLDAGQTFGVPTLVPQSPPAYEVGVVAASAGRVFPTSGDHVVKRELHTFSW